MDTGSVSHHCSRPPAQQEWQEKEKGNLQERFFGDRSQEFSECKGFFCAVMSSFFVLQCQQVGEVQLEDHILVIFLPASPSFPAAVPVMLVWSSDICISFFH